MADIKEQADWPEGVYLIEKTDPVEGGEDGVDNKQAKALANRTQYLKKALEDSNSAAASQIELEKTYVDSLQNKRRLFDVSGTENDIILTSKAGITPITELNDFDEFSFIVAATNTDVVTIKIDGLAALNLSGVVSDTQIFETALLTVRYIAEAFYIADQINPKTGNPVALIGNVLSSAFAQTGACKMRFDGGDLSRATHPILFAKAQKSGLIDQATKDADLQTYGGFWGDGDGLTTFTSPIYDGAFARFSDNGRGLDVGRELGSWQDDQIESHTHEYKGYTGQTNDFLAGSGVSDFGLGSYGGITTGIFIGHNGGNETRSKNYSVNAEFLV